MKTPALDILVISDLHYMGNASAACSAPARRCEWGALLLRKALLRLRHQGIQPNLILLLGDIVNDGTASDAEQDLRTVADFAHKIGVPVLAVPGNHDGAAARIQRIFRCPPGLYEIGGYGFLLFHDEVGEGDVTVRPLDGLSLPQRAAKSKPGLPLIALQHNPLHPPIVSDYPFMPVNTKQILKSYADAGVWLSLSGHYHPGEPPSSLNGVTYYTVPALCEAPFRFALLRLRDRSFELNELHLQMDTPGLWDVHCHTEFSYCGTTVRARRNIELSRELGLAGLCLTEHAFQLYFENETAWSFRWQTDPILVRRTWSRGRHRMQDYRQFVAPLRDRFVRLGLEVDLRSNSRLLLAPEDAQGWDILVGSVHQIPALDMSRTAQEDAERLFLRETARLLKQPIQVLAHPFRFFRRAQRARPQHLYGEVASMLARSGVAAEINYHTNSPDPLFLRECVKRGVRLALGTDSHDLEEVGELYPHLAVLQEAGISKDELPHVLFRPAAVRHRKG